MPAVSYECWVKVGKYDKTKGWIVSQYPDYGWSRALTLSDTRMGAGPAITPGGFNYGTQRQPTDTWFHLVGAFEQGKPSTVYVDGVSGNVRTGRNGVGTNVGEMLVIGGRGPNDGAHNMHYVSIASVRVYTRRLQDADAKALKKGECAAPLGIYECHCKKGWIGDNCASTCPDHKTWVDGECWGACDSFPCKHGGVCSDQGMKYTCKCEKGWHGDNCAIEDEDCTSKPCQNGGKCSEPTESDMCSDKIPERLSPALKLDLRGHTYVKGSSTWKNRVQSGPSASVSSSVI